MSISQEEWNKLPDNIRREITAYAQAAQRAAQWDQWAEPNRELLQRWPETVKRLREAQDAEEARAAEDMTFEEVQKQTRQRAREAQEHRQYIQDLAGQLGQTRQQLEQLAQGQRTSVNIAAHLAKWQAEDPRRDARELYRLAQERNAQNFEDATRIYDEEQAKRQQGNTRTVRFTRPGADENRQRRFSRDIQVADDVMRVLNEGAGDFPQSPTQMVWKKGHRAGSPVPELNSESR